MAKKQIRANLEWYTFDFHIHTPASSDFQQQDVSYLDILQRAEARGLDIIAFTDHNTVAGYRKMMEEVRQLELLENLKRLLPEESQRLAEFRRLFSKVLVLPGFEFTATFGFHIIGLFSPAKATREIEHLLLDLNIPPAQLDEGSATVGATTDVLTAYRIINEAGGLVIAAHANSSNGVAMRGFSFGGQTKIAYTQDPNLHALEVTDLELKSPRSTATFFNGTKPEYPRRMHCIQGSDSHRLTSDPQRKKNPAVGDRTTDVLLPEVSFDALLELFKSNDFSRTRPHTRKEEPVYDFIQTALEEGPNIIQEFHESMTVRGGKLYAIIADVCAFANTNGGTLYIGLSSDPKKAPLGVPEPEQSLNQLSKEISNRISPPISCTLDLHDHKGKKIIRVLVPRGDDTPYAVDDNKIYVRDEAEIGLAVRDEIVNLVLRSAKAQAQPRAQQTTKPVAAPASEPAAQTGRGRSRAKAQPQQPAASQQAAVYEQPAAETAGELAGDMVDVASDAASGGAGGGAPRTGVEVLPAEEREGARYYAMRDLRNGNTVKNVTRTSARRLWHYAINQYNDLEGKDLTGVEWHGDYGLIKKYKHGKSHHYDLIQRTPEGYRYYFGVTEDGVHGPWIVVTGEEEN